MMNVGIVIPVGPGRMENLVQLLGCLRDQTEPIDCIVIVQDGPEAHAEVPFDFGEQEHVVIRNYKHEPGLEQPRNVGVRMLRHFSPTTDHVWFLDSDLLVLNDCLERYQEIHEAVRVCDCGHAPADHDTYDASLGDNPIPRTQCLRCSCVDPMEEPLDRILIGPYDWMDPNVRHPIPELHNDPRWPSFSTYEREYVSRGKLNDGLACFSGNLIWPIDEFTRIGGFWNEIHHARCEDGELGLRAVKHDVPISFVKEARGWHIWHPVNAERSIAANARDVPMLNARHPWVQGEGVFVVERDGRRFDQRCATCGETVNTLDWWTHMADHSDLDAIMPTAMPGG